MKKILLLAAVAAAFVSMSPTARADGPAPEKPAAPVVTVPTYENATCPIMGRPSSKAFFTDTEFGRVYVCCPPCIKKVQADAERACKAAYPVVKKAGNTIDPVTGAKVGDKPVLATLQGYEIAFANEENVKAARANLQIVLTKAINADVVDVGNHTDPITNQPIANNAFVLIDKNLVRLSSPTSVDAVKADPAKALKAAKDIAAKEAEAREKAKKVDPGMADGAK